MFSVPIFCCCCCCHVKETWVRSLSYIHAMPYHVLCFFLFRSSFAWQLLLRWSQHRPFPVIGTTTLTNLATQSRQNRRSMIRHPSDRQQQVQPMLQKIIVRQSPSRGFLLPNDLLCCLLQQPPPRSDEHRLCPNNNNKQTNHLLWW
jgi:hypothetical protein